MNAYSAPAAFAAPTGLADEKPAVRFERIEKSYAVGVRKIHALKTIDLAIPRGKIFGIIGRSGAGKSSLLRLINRLERPSSGKVFVDGVDLDGLDEAALVAERRKIGMIFQHFNLLSAKTVAQNVALPLRVAGFSRAEIFSRVEQALSLVGLDAKAGIYPSRLSGGQKQRVGIARALVGHPKILLCDEATSALDPETTLSILNLLRDINRQLGLTIVLITHEMSVIREICDRVAVLDHGELVEQGEAFEALGAPKAEATKSLLAPLHHPPPDSILRRLHTGSPQKNDLAALRLGFSGGQPPDLAKLAEILGPATIARGNLDDASGRALGALTFLLPHQNLPAPEILREIAQTSEVLGYVADDA